MYTEYIGNDGFTYWRVQFKSDGKQVGHATSRWYAQAQSVAFNWVYNKANEKELMNRLVEHNLLT